MGDRKSFISVARGLAGGGNWVSFYLSIFWPGLYGYPTEILTLSFVLFFSLGFSGLWVQKSLRG